MKSKNVSFVATAVALVIGSGAFADTISVNSCGANLTNAPVVFNSYERPLALQQAAVIPARSCGLQQAAVIAAPACGAPAILQQSAVIPAQPVGIIKPARRWFELSVLGMGLRLGPRRARLAGPVVVEPNLVQPAVIAGTSCNPAVITGSSCNSAVIDRTLMQPALIDRSCEMNSKILYDYPATVAAPVVAQPAIVEEQQIVQPAVVEKTVPASKTIILHDTEKTVKTTVTHTMQRVYRKQCATKRVAKKHCARQVRRRVCIPGS